MIEQLINNISESEINSFFRRNISGYRIEKDELEYIIPETGYQQFSELNKLGEWTYENTDELLVFACKYNGELTARSSKKKQYDLAKKVLKEDFKDGAIFIFYDEAGRFRFSFIRRNYDDDSAKYTPFKRYTYFVKPEEQNKTFKKRIEKCKFQSLDEIQHAFSVEPLSKDFYRDLSNWYFAAMSKVKFPNSKEENIYNLNANSLIRLITRIMFVWFMKQKGLIPSKLFDKDYLKEILHFSDITDSTYYRAILQNLFFATLNTPRTGKGREFIKEFKGKSNQQGIQNYFRYEDLFKDKDSFVELMDHIPFLNGGLFENLDVRDENYKLIYLIDCFSNPKINRAQLQVPDILFFGKWTADLSEFYETGSNEKVEITGLIDILNRFDFTIDENTPYDQEVALDPELLGLVFENLLASYNPETQSTARKESGSFYTPRPIVDYMVEESLVHYVSTDTGLSIDLLRQVFDATDDQPFEKEEERSEIIKSISNLKIIDPACGSGAYPMGALQKMVHALSKLDPDNILWRKSQKDRLMKDTFAAFETSDLNNLKKEVDAIFDNQLNDPDYARKLYLIENCLYGVDIQPIAMQISKLRFFISLLVEQHIDKDHENFGIVALPNLETKFVAANTLIKLDKPVSQQHGTVGTLLLQNPKIAELQKELETVRHKYFTARTPKTKSKHRKKDREIREEISELLINDGWSNDGATKITQWDPFNPNSKSSWFDCEWMFGLKGFDIVIGNPPYISLQRMSDSEKYNTENYFTYARTGDLYSLFFEKGVELLSSKGHLCYITSNKWLNANYGKNTRKYLATQSNPLILIDFLKVKIFESATVFVNVLLTQKVKNQNQLEACAIKGHKLPKQDLREYFNQNKIVLKEVGETVWKVNNVITQKINKQIETKGEMLSNKEVWSSIEFFRGITTGFNKAFHIEEKEKNELIKNKSTSKDVIKPLLRGKDIKRWQYTFNQKHIIFTRQGIDIKNYPAIEEYLRGYYQELLPKSKPTDKTGRKPGSYKWFEIQDNTAYYKFFEKSKIIWIEISDKANFTLDEAGMYLTNSAYFISGDNLKFILAILNSKVADFYLFQITATIAGGRKRYTKQYIEQIPIPKIPVNEQKPFEKLADYLLILKEQEDTKTYSVILNHFEQILNAMVYELYFEELVKGKGYDVIKYVKDFPIISNHNELEKLKHLFTETSKKDHPIQKSIFLIDSIPEIAEISKVYQN